MPRLRRSFVVASLFCLVPSPSSLSLFRLAPSASLLSSFASSLSLRRLVPSYFRTFLAPSYRRSVVLLPRSSFFASCRSFASLFRSVAPLYREVRENTIGMAPMEFHTIGLVNNNKRQLPNAHNTQGGSILYARCIAFSHCKALLLRPREKTSIVVGRLARLLRPREKPNFALGRWARLLRPTGKPSLVVRRWARLLRPREKPSFVVGALLRAGKKTVLSCFRNRDDEPRGEPLYIACSA